MRLNIFLLGLTTLLTNSCITKHGENYKTSYISDSKGNILIQKYFRNMLVEERRYFKDTTNREGRSMFYSTKGVLLKIEHWNNNKLTGFYLENYINGKPKHYICFDSYGDTIFYRQYDSLTQNIVKENGDIQSRGFIDTDNALKDSTVVFNSFIVKPPHTSISIRNYLLYNNKTDTLFSIDTSSMYNWIYSFTYKIPKSGAYMYVGHSILIDSMRDLSYRDKDSVSFSVKLE